MVTTVCNPSGCFNISHWSWLYFFFSLWKQKQRSPSWLIPTLLTLSDLKWHGCRAMSWDCPDNFSMIESATTPQQLKPVAHALICCTMTALVLFWALDWSDACIVLISADFTSWLDPPLCFHSVHWAAAQTARPGGDMGRWDISFYQLV